MRRSCKWEEIIVMCPTAGQQTYDPIREDVTRFSNDPEHDLELLEDLAARSAELEDGEHGREPALLVIDDCAGQSWTNTGRKGGLPTLANNARWCNLSIIVITQSLASVTPAFRESAEAVMMFRSINAKEIDYLVEERNTQRGNRKRMRAVYNCALQEPFDFYFQVTNETGMWDFRNWNVIISIPPGEEDFYLD